MRKAFTSVAMAHQGELLKNRRFLKTEFLDGFKNWGPELNDLEERGLLKVS